MQSHVFRFPAKQGRPLRWFYCSDLHLGSVHADTRRIAREFKRADELDAAVLINGDIVDGIVSGDKRYLPGEPVPELERAKTPTKTLIDMIVETLWPIAHRLYVAGVGNHEETWVKYYKADPVGMAIDALNARLADKGHAHRIRHGGISGFIVTKLDVPSGKGKPLTLTHKTYYHHGAGGDAAVTKGLIGVNRTTVGFEFDCMTQGHRHHIVNSPDVVIGVRSTGEIYEKPIVALLTGSYFRNLSAGSQDEPLSYSYAESKGHRGKPMGGMFLCLTPEVYVGHRDKRVWTVRQDYHSALMPTATPTTAA